MNAAPADPLRLVVLGDSTAFTDDEGPQLPDVSHLYPNVVARRLEKELGRPVDLTTLARAGWVIRDVWRTLTKDRHVMFDVLMGADAVVVHVGSFDQAPAGLPSVVDAVTPFLRPSRLRRAVRKALHRFHPVGVRLTSGRYQKIPPAEFERLFDKVLIQIRGLAHGAAGVVLGPTSQRADYYANIHPTHPRAEAAQLAQAERHGFAAVPCWEHVLPHLDRLNEDRIHWPPDVHEAVGEAVASALLDQLEGRAPRPPLPGEEPDGSP